MRISHVGEEGGRGEGFNCMGSLLRNADRIRFNATIAPEIESVQVALEGIWRLGCAGHRFVLHDLEAGQWNKDNGLRLHNGA